MSNPSGDSTILGLSLGVPLNGSEFVPADQLQGPIYVTVRIPLSSFSSIGVPGLSFGTTAQRPTSPVISQPYLDTTLGIPIWCSQVSPTVKWIDAAGVQV